MGEGSGWLDEGRNGCCCSVFIIQPELATEVINILAREREREPDCWVTLVYISHFVEPLTTGNIIRNFEEIVFIFSRKLI